MSASLTTPLLHPPVPAGRAPRVDVAPNPEAQPALPAAPPLLRVPAVGVVVQLLAVLLPGGAVRLDQMRPADGALALTIRYAPPGSSATPALRYLEPLPALLADKLSCMVHSGYQNQELRVLLVPQAGPIFSDTWQRLVEPQHYAL